MQNCINLNRNYISYPICEKILLHKNVKTYIFHLEIPIVHAMFNCVCRKTWMVKVMFLFYILVDINLNNNYKIVLIDLTVGIQM